MLRLHGHANLGELEDEFEEGEEGDHVLSHAWVGDLSEDISLVSILVHIDLLGHILDPALLEDGWIGLLDRLGERVWARENFLSLGSLVARMGIAGREDTDVAQELVSRRNGWASADLKDLFDLLQRLVVNSLGEPGLVLVHGGEQLVEVGKLFVRLLHSCLFELHLLQDSLVLLLSRVLLNLDLNS